MASHKYDILDEHGTGASGGKVQGLGTWTGPTLHLLRYPNLLVEADLTALTGTSPTAQLKIDSSADGVTWGNGDVYSGPVYSAAVAHWGYRGAPSTTNQNFRIRVIVGGTTPQATFAVTVLGAANA